MKESVFDELGDFSITYLGAYGFVALINMILKKKHYKERRKAECEKAVLHRSHCICYKRVGSKIVATYELPCKKNGVPSTWFFIEEFKEDPFDLYTENEWKK